MFEPNFQRNEKHLLNLDQLIHEQKSKLIVRCEIIQRQQLEINKITLQG